MRVTLDEQIFAIQPYGGISRVFAQLADRFINGSPGGVELLPLNSPVVNRYLLDSGKLREHLRIWESRNQWTSLAHYFWRSSPRTSPELVHNTFYLPQGLWRNPGIPRIVTIHDMIPELLPHSRRRLDWITLKRRYVASAAHIICVSEATKQDLIKVYGPPTVPVTVVHHGVDDRFRPGIARAEFLPERYILFVGHRAGYKDADVLFRAFEQVARHDPTIELLCVGGNGLSHDEVRRLRELGVRERVSQRHLVDDEMISAYAHALLFVFPSHFEGFGLTALEAMACGAPTILARATSLPEVGGEAAAYFEPGSATDLAREILRLLADDDARAGLSRRGMERARHFTWVQAATRTADVYHQVLETT